MTIITLITFLATLTATSGQPTDLCDTVYTDTGRPVFCEPHPDGAPRWDATVCCNDAGCVPSGASGCSAGRKAFYCELGEVWADGEVSCYFEVPDYCDVFPCAPGFQTWPQAAPICCYGGICWHSDGSRRMSDSAAHLVDEVLPKVPVRQWVCSLPWQLRYAMGYDAKLCSAVLAAFIGALRRSLRRRAKRMCGLDSVEDAQFGAVTFIQRADSSLRLNVRP